MTDRTPHGSGDARAVGAEPTPRVLIIEDDAGIAEAVGEVVQRQGCLATVATDGREGLRLFFDDRPDLVVLDIGLPVMDGWEVLGRIRDLSDVPVLLLTAMDLERDKVRGFEGGADDYLTKPFGVQELGARIMALLRRSRSRNTPSAGAADVYRSGGLTIDWVAREVRADGQVVDLTPLEFRLLRAFVRHPGQALSAEQLIRLAWGDSSGIGSERVKFTLMRLRKKLGWQGDEGQPIRAVRGYGYRYTPEP